MAKVIMIQGTNSNAGKSLITAALCRIFKQDGYKVAPFKSQNMALNSYITKNGLEMGRAQAVQAEAAGIEPDVRMNPILLKPTGSKGSQIVLNGKVFVDMTAGEYNSYKEDMIPHIMSAYNSLAEENDIIVIEGAGSPAEINLRDKDIVNMGMAKLVDAPVIIVGDIDRGGVFASLAGTMLLFNEEERTRVKGFVINKFRGEEKFLKPGLEMLYDITKVNTLGVVPYLNVDIEDEDSLSVRLASTIGKKLIDIAVIRLPHISNFT
ncbi:MAG: cobyric acid synthase, partial [Tissierellia bacterium]|nr:cobyric acid synthase [Tissierellia bacterium]